MKFDTEEFDKMSQSELESLQRQFNSAVRCRTEKQRETEKRIKVGELKKIQEELKEFKLLLDSKNFSENVNIILSLPLSLSFEPETNLFFWDYFPDLGNEICDETEKKIAASKKLCGKLEEINQKYQKFCDSVKELAKVKDVDLDILWDMIDVNWYPFPVS